MKIGIEGVSCTGKTTLAFALAARLGHTSLVPCYYHAAPDASALPDPDASSEDEQLDALVVHLEIELLRQHRAQAAVERGCHVVLDRTVDTLLAHLRAIGEMKNLDANARARSLVAERVDCGQAVVPDVTLLLHADDDVLSERASARIAMPGIYYDPRFAQAFHTHFLDPITPKLLRLDASRPADDVLERAVDALGPYVAVLR
ncbi:AAA family ATPase [Streptomyces sp. SID3343]|uniref:AAA family ATPase n=1 Tax=Streptomyces sp. SID3343 TaxID=2690260 RepID=UPI00136B2F07|nr:AAA family ATPase [Streptomyces sp. SID3343]